MQTGDGPSNPGDLLRERLVAFQREIAELKQLAQEQAETHLHQERTLFAELFEVLDVFDNLELTLRRRPEPFEKTSQSLLNSMKAVQRKLLRLLASRQIEPLEFPDRQAKLEQCVIVETRSIPGRANEEILAVLKRGYLDTAHNAVLRKAEVVTVRNADVKRT
jgi:molecular chaperone GrpE (heat shock protein)